MKLYKIRFSLWLWIAAGMVSTASAQQVLTLEQARQLALGRNNNINIAQQNINAAKEASNSANVAGRPTLDGTVTGFYFGKPLDKLLPQYGGAGVGTVTQAIYTGGKIKLGKDAANKTVQLNEAEKLLNTSDVLLDVEKAYWQIVSAKEKVALSQKFKTQLVGLHTELRNSYDAGLTYKNDVLRVEVQQNDNELNLIRANDGLLLSKLNLAQLIGQSNQINFQVADSVVGVFEPVVGDTSLTSIAGRPELLILKKSIEIGQVQEKLLKADTKPYIGLTLNGLSATGAKGINFTDPSSRFLNSYYGLFNVNIPIFDWGARKHKVKEQSFKNSATQIQFEDTKQLISIEVQQAYLQLNQSAKNVQLSLVSLTQADENLRLSNDRLKAGTITGKDVLEAQTIWQQAYANIIDAKVEYKINTASLKKALGQLK